MTTKVGGQTRDRLKNLGGVLFAVIGEPVAAVTTKDGGGMRDRLKNLGGVSFAVIGEPVAAVTTKVGGQTRDRLKKLDAGRECCPGSWIRAQRWALELLGSAGQHADGGLGSGQGDRGNHAGLFGAPAQQRLQLAAVGHQLVIANLNRCE